MQYISDKMKFEQNEIIINSHMQFRSPTLLYIVKVMFELKQKKIFISHSNRNFNLDTT